MIKYTKNITNKLKSMEFKFCYEQEKHDEAEYEVWVKGVLEVTVGHTEKIVYVAIIMEDTVDLPINTLYELQSLDRLINKK